MARYRVVADDNFHYQNIGGRSEHGIYENPQEALAACRKMVDQSLKAMYKPGMSADELYDHYTSFGDDPFIVALVEGQETPNFSAWSYAKERCPEICAEGESKS